MTVAGIPRTKQGLTVLLVDSDPRFLTDSCKQLAEAGCKAWGAEDLIAAANFLADQRPDVLVVELELLEMDGAEPLADLKARAPTAPTILLGSGPPDERLRELQRLHDIYGYHDKLQGNDALALWVSAALTTTQQQELIQRTRQRLRQVIDAVPDLHRIQSLDEVLSAVLEQVDALVGGQNGFVAARLSDPVGKPPIVDYEEVVQSSDDYVIGAANSDVYARGTTVDRIKAVPAQMVRRALEERSHVLDARHGILPLALAEHVLGLAYVEKPCSRESDVEVLQLYGNQAAAAIRNAVLYELATVDSTTRVFRKSFTLERLRQTIKLAWRKALPVSALMLDIDQFKKLNDEHGHVVGDRALRHLGNLLKQKVRDSDVVGRFGGDEFLVILIDADYEGVKIVADRLRDALASDRKGSWPSSLPALRVSMGTATLDPGDVPPFELGFPDFPAVVESVVAEADAAMYRARRERQRLSSGRTLFWPDFVKR